MMSMGSYGMYVWPAYGITLLVFGINFFAAWAEKKQIKQMMEQCTNSTDAPGLTSRGTSAHEAVSTYYES